MTTTTWGICGRVLFERLLRRLLNDELADNVKDFDGGGWPKRSNHRAGPTPIGIILRKARPTGQVNGTLAYRERHAVQKAYTSHGRTNTNFALSCPRDPSIAVGSLAADRGFDPSQANPAQPQPKPKQLHHFPAIKFLCSSIYSSKSRSASKSGPRISFDCFPPLSPCVSKSLAEDAEWPRGLLLESVAILPSPSLLVMRSSGSSCG